MKFIRVILLIMVLLELTSCNSANSASEITSNIDTTDMDKQLVDLILSELKNDYDGTYTVEILDILRQERDVFSKFKIVHDGNNFEGTLYSQYNNDDLRIIEFSYVSLDTEAFTQTILGGRLVGDIKRPYTVVSGIINNPDIKSVIIKYFDKHTTLLQIGDDQTSYFDVRIGNNQGAMSITGLDGQGNEVKSIQW